MSPKAPPPPRKPQAARPAPSAAAAPAAAKAPGQPVEFKHPVLDEAREHARHGRMREAADLLTKLAPQVPPPQRAQVLAIASQFLRSTDRKTAVALAQQATQAHERTARAWIALAFAVDERRERKQALAAAQKALSLPITPRERLEMGRFMAKLGDDKVGLEAVLRGYELAGQPLELATYVLRVALQCADWGTSEPILKRLGEAYDQGQYDKTQETPRTHVLWRADDHTNIRVISHFAARTFAPREPMVTQAWPGAISAQRPLRVAYLSSDYRDHATSLLALGMMRHHERERFRFYAYCTSYDDGSTLRREMLNRFDVARSFAQASDERAARQIVNDKIDVLVDLNGLTEGTRHGILAWRPAPVQISYLGFPGTAGGRFVDYIIGDPYTVPDESLPLYPEKVIRIPPTYQINDYAARWLPPRSRRPAELSASAAAEATGAAAADTRQILGMFNNVNKVSPAVWQVWMRILREQPSAVLWMMDPGEQAQTHLRAATTAAGVDLARVIFAPKVRQEQHVARLQWCDLVLDPWPYGGHTTTGDALFAAVPVVALQGTNFASRVSGGLLLAAGLGELICPDTESYVRTTLELLRNPERLRAMRRELRQRRTSLPVFDAATRTRQLEAAYLEAHARRLAGKPPRHFDIRVNPPARRAA